MAYTDEDRRNHIREVQEYLRAISFFDKRIPQIGVDGIFGARTEEAVAAAREAISTGELQIFSGEITDNEGNVVVAEGQTLTDAEILAITWFCEGITVN